MIFIYGKCPICGKLFKANTHGRPRKYCSKECSIKANLDKTNKRNSHRWYHDIEYRKQKVLKHGEGIGTITLAENKDNDWEKELIRVRALKKQAGLNRRA